MIKEIESIKTTRQLQEFAEAELSNFYQERIKVDSPPPHILNIRARWQDLGFRGFDPIFLPGTRFSKELNYSGWRIKPSEWFFQQIEAARVPNHPLSLRRGWALVDTTPRPNYRGDSLIKPSEDQLAAMLKDLRISEQLALFDSEGKVVKIDARTSISKDDVETIVYPKLSARLLKTNEGRITSLKAIEFNFLGNLRYPGFGEGVRTQEFFEDSYSVGENSASLTLRGGANEEGGIAHVDYCSTFNRLSHNFFRPVVFIGAHLTILR